MKHFLFILILIILSTFCYSQSSRNRKNADDCIYKKKYTAVQREGIYPFSKAFFIQFVSYNDTSYMNKLDDNHKWVVFTDFEGSIMKIPRTIETVHLNPQQRDTLSDVLYNNFFKRVSSIRKITQCYFPRNAIVFYDEENKPFACIEICFECNRVKFIPEDIGRRINMCDQMTFKLKTLFRNFGITYGLEMNQTDR